MNLATTREHSVKYVSRRGKELIKHAFIATGNEENEYGKSMVPRVSPFRSSSMDVLQSRQTSCRSNKWQTNPCKHGATLLQSPALKRHRCGKSGPNGGTCSGCFAVACAADDLDEILSDVEPVKAAVAWKNCWNQNGSQPKSLGAARFAFQASSLIPSFMSVHKRTVSYLSASYLKIMSGAPFVSVHVRPLAQSFIESVEKPTKGTAQGVQQRHPVYYLFWRRSLLPSDRSYRLTHTTVANASEKTHMFTKSIVIEMTGCIGAKGVVIWTTTTALASSRGWKSLGSERHKDSSKDMASTTSSMAATLWPRVKPKYS